MTGDATELSEGAGVLAFPFRFVPAYRRSGMFFGIHPHSAQVNLDHSVFEARFGPWRITTPLDNIAGTTTTGPYRWHRTAGPARYSFADHGLTFATNSDLGLCIAFHEPVTGVEPMRVLHHPTLTVTVADVAELAEVLARHASDQPGRVLRPVPGSGTAAPRPDLDS